MIRIAISSAAFEAIAQTLPLGSAGVDPEANAKGERTVWLEEVWVDCLGAMRASGESYSDVILRIATGRHERLATTRARSLPTDNWGNDAYANEGLESIGRQAD
jgi:hypothetical protein